MLGVFNFAKAFGVVAMFTIALYSVESKSEEPVGMRLNEIAKVAPDKSLFLKDIEVSLKKADHLPLEWASETLMKISIQFHNDNDRLLVDYEVSSEQVVLFFYEPFYLRDQKMIPFEQWTVETVAPFFEALYNAYVFYHQNEEGFFSSDDQELANQTYVDIREVEMRPRVLLDAEAQWVGSVLSIANSLKSSQVRNPKLCDNFERVPMFRFWDRAFVDADYFGGYHDGQKWVESVIDLPIERRTFVSQFVFKGRFTGKSEKDFCSLHN
ncbi:MAG: hypothetical protein KDD25_05385 [Bdellovibrionales bacterium]|nr:hypothetical protein [Bdellovibrionales bacterium]